jgi:hypothetical protein
MANEFLRNHHDHKHDLLSSRNALQGEVINDFGAKK